MRSKVEERTRACLSDVELKSKSQSPASESTNTGATRLPSALAATVLLYGGLQTPSALRRVIC